MGGSTRRMCDVAEALAEEFHLSDDEKKQMDMSRTDRFVIYKVGPILSVSVSDHSTCSDSHVVCLAAWNGSAINFSPPS